jgi:hypothetical protein
MFDHLVALFLMKNNLLSIKPCLSVVFQFIYGNQQFN